MRCEIMARGMVRCRNKTKTFYDNWPHCEVFICSTHAKQLHRGKVVIDCEKRHWRRRAAGALERVDK